MPLCLKVLPEEWVVSVGHHEPYKTIAQDQRWNVM